MPPLASYILISLRQHTYPLKLPLKRYLTLWIFIVCLLLLEKTCKTVVHTSSFFSNYHCLLYYLWVDVFVCMCSPCYWKTQKIGLLLTSISAIVSAQSVWLSRSKAVSHFHLGLRSYYHPLPLLYLTLGNGKYFLSTHGNKLPDFHSASGSSHPRISLIPQATCNLNLGIFSKVVLLLTVILPVSIPI